MVRISGPETSKVKKLEDSNNDKDKLIKSINRTLKIYGTVQKD